MFMYLNSVDIRCISIIFAQSHNLSDLINAGDWSRDFTNILSRRDYPILVLVLFIQMSELAEMVLILVNITISVSISVLPSEFLCM